MSAKFNTVEIWIQAFIPMTSVNALGTCFSGDDRDFSSDHEEQRFRARSEIIVSGFLTQAPESTEFHQCGETRQIDCTTGEVLKTGTASTAKMVFHHFHVGNTFPDAQGGVIDNPNEFCANVLYDGATSNPLLLSPDVDINFFFTIDPVGRTVSARGAVNEFPDYEAYVRVDGGVPISLFRHRHSLDPVAGLPGGADQSITATINV